MQAIAASLSSPRSYGDIRPPLVDDSQPLELWSATSVKDLVIDEFAKKAALWITVKRDSDGVESHFGFFWAADRVESTVEGLPALGTQRGNGRRRINFEEASRSIRAMAEALSRNEEGEFSQS